MNPPLGGPQHYSFQRTSTAIIVGHTTYNLSVLDLEPEITRNFWFYLKHIIGTLDLAPRPRPQKFLFDFLNFAMSFSENQPFGSLECDHDKKKFKGCSCKTG